MAHGDSEHTDDSRRSVDAICALAGWTRRDLAARLGVGESVFHYYERDIAPRWLSLALLGLAVGELGLPLSVTRALCGETAPGARVDA